MNELREETSRKNGPSSGQPGAENGGHDEHPIPQDLPQMGAGAMALVAVAALLLLGALFMLGWMPHRRQEAELQKEAAEARETRPVVEVSAPKKSDAATDLLLPGDVQPMQETAVFARASGYLKTLKVDIGQEVKAGQLLAEIDAPEVDAQLEQARAALQQANVVVGRANNEFNFQKATYERYQGLSATGGVTQQQLDEKRAAFNISTSSLKAAEASVAAAKAEVQRYTELKGFQKVLAPFDGTITARNYDLGALLSPTNAAGGKELFRLAHTDTLRVFVNVPQGYVTSVKLGHPAELFVRNYPGKPFIGTVTRTAGALDPQTRTLRFEVDFPNQDHQLFPGMYGQIKFKVQPDQPTITVPTSALVYGADGMHVAVVEDNKVRYQKVSVGRDFGTEAEVASGLNGGEQIITNPGERLTDGTEVQVIRPDQTAQGPGRKQPQVAAK